MLATQRADFRDFRMRMVARWAGERAAWVCVRSDMTPDLMKGYAVHIGGGKEPDGTTLSPGSITTLRGLGKGVRVKCDQPAKEVGIGKGDWYTLDVEAVGDRICTSVNGKSVAEFTDPQRLYASAASRWWGGPTRQPSTGPSRSKT